ncbi:MAG: hypothetical protein M9951_01375 [Burkholderiaceae bacterium]|nr:hypothetical protein [Burkholderiaceae bacterium]
MHRGRESGVGRRNAAWALFWVALLGSSAAGEGSSSPLFRDADLQLGEQLIVEHKCEACHIKRVGGDGTSIYSPVGRIRSASALLAMVEACNTEMGLGMFPEEVAAVAAVLNRDHYEFD